MSIMPNNIANEIEHLPSLSLNELAGVALMDRIDKKFIFHRNKLSSVLQELSKHYRILEVDNTRLQTYSTTYFDTPDKQMFYAHHNGLRYRQKIRVRTYVQSDKTFLEIKTKTNRNKTLKKRIPIAAMDLLAKKQSTFIEDLSKFEALKLEAVLESSFQRITMAGLSNTERITLDLNLAYQLPSEKKEWQNANLCIAEIKSERSSGFSRAQLILKQHKIFASGFSKYCFGICNLYPHLKQNRFKSYFLHLRKLQII